MGDLLPIRRNDHEGLGLEALKALQRGDKDSCIRALAQAFLDSSGDRERARPLVTQMNALLHSDPGAA